MAEWNIGLMRSRKVPTTEWKKVIVLHDPYNINCIYS